LRKAAKKKKANGGLKKMQTYIEKIKNSTLEKRQQRFNLIVDIVAIIAIVVLVALNI